MREKNNISPPNPLKKEKNKERKKKQKFDHSYLTNDYCKLIKIRCVASPRWQAATNNVKITCSSERVMELYMRENWILVLPVNIHTHGVTRWHPWPHDTPPCVLIHTGL